MPTCLLGIDVSTTALMTFATLPWYPRYASLTTAGGVTPIQDQQLAGLIMWIPVGFVFTLLTIVYFAAFLGALERHSARSQRCEDLERART